MRCFAFAQAFLLERRVLEAEPEKRASGEEMTLTIVMVLLASEALPFSPKPTTNEASQSCRSTFWVCCEPALSSSFCVLFWFPVHASSPLLHLIHTPIEHAAHTPRFCLIDGLLPLVPPSSKGAGLQLRREQGTWTVPVPVDCACACGLSLCLCLCRGHACAASSSCCVVIPGCSKNTK